MTEVKVYCDICGKVLYKKDPIEIEGGRTTRRIVIESVVIEPGVRMDTDDLHIEDVCGECYKKVKDYIAAIKTATFK